MTNAALVGLFVLAVAVAAAAVLKNSGASGGADSPAAPGRSGAPLAAETDGGSTSTSTPSTEATGQAAPPTPTVTIQTENNVLDGLDGVAPPGTVQWDDFHVFNQSPGVDVAVSEAVDGTGAMAFFAFPSSDAAQAFVNDPPTHLPGIGDYAALESLTPVPGAPAGADVYDLRGCVSPNGLVVGCTGGSPTRSGGVAVVVPLDDFVLVAVSWHPADAASPATQQRAFTEVADGQALWTRTPH